MLLFDQQGFYGYVKKTFNSMRDIDLIADIPLYVMNNESFTMNIIV